MKFTANQIAQILEGEIEGDSEAEVSRLSKIEEGTNGSLTFLSNPKYNSYLYTTEASITIVNDTFKLEKEVRTTLIRVKDAYKAFSKVLEFYNQVKNNKLGREEPHYISETAVIGKDEYIGAFSHIGNNVVEFNFFVLGPLQRIVLSDHPSKQGKTKSYFLILLDLLLLENSDGITHNFQKEFRIF